MNECKYMGDYNVKCEMLPKDQVHSAFKMDHKDEIALNQILLELSVGQDGIPSHENICGRYT